jgi:hypothetical protein
LYVFSEDYRSRRGWWVGGRRDEVEGIELYLEGWSSAVCWGWLGQEVYNRHFDVFERDEIEREDGG